MKAAKSRNGLLHHAVAKSDQRTGMVRPNNRQAEMMLLDSGTTSHMTPSIHNGRDRSERQVSISLGDEATVVSSDKWTWSVHWYAEQSMINFDLSETQIEEDLAMNLISGPAVVSKVI